MNMFDIQTAESVTEGHPDKIADQISDAVVDATLAKDPDARVACETLISNGFCVIAGEVRTDSYIPITDIARQTIREIGYTDSDLGFDYRASGVLTAIGEQSSDIAAGVDREEGLLGAGDQGTMYGYACRETDTLMPLPITLAHRMTMAMADARKSGRLPFLRPDGKAQVVVRYEEGMPKEVLSVVVSSQHAPEISGTMLEEALTEEVIFPAIPEALRPRMERIINPTGMFVIGGPQADTGLTGRKNIVDAYGGVIPHGGGCLSGKDPSKVDRSGAYMARYVAKNIVASGAAERVMVQVSYAIGVPRPLIVDVECFGTGKVEKGRLLAAVADLFDFSPAGMIAALELQRPVYRRLAAYGHFGRELEGVLWERTDRAEALKEALGI